MILTENQDYHIMSNYLYQLSLKNRFDND